MKSSAVRYWLTLLLSLLGAYGAYTGWKVYRKLSSSEQPALAIAGPSDALVGTEIGPFQLTTQAGEPFDSRELDGQTWVASFFFSSCPGSCIKMNNTIARLQSELADSGVRFVSITVDPENDTPEELAKYARHYGADSERWLFLTGPAEELKRVAMKEFLVAFGRGTHSEKFFVVGPDQKIAGLYTSTADADIVLLKRKVKELVEQSK
jgi:cytochrome oxidase Cu insertion factor (SCO1/SenC/PrrC family)